MTKFLRAISKIYLKIKRFYFFCLIPWVIKVKNPWFLIWNLYFGLKCTCILKFTSTEMQYEMYLPTSFYYSFSLYILNRNEIPIFLFSITAKYTFLGLHPLAQWTYFAMTGWYWNWYVIFIQTLYTELMYWIWQMTHQHEVCAMYFHIQYCATPYISHSYHTNHKIMSSKKLVHTFKPLRGQLFYRSLRG